ncbi:TonB-dependent receptor [Pedobacter sp. MC2016-14]|uniref:SusC/RagA family TonB-linked outer membrane protein n=1 Tax=Pedobacter sp. MC2016-14 TaxID=2897327 RepID=UPI001E400507|nr:TonB-dependent receptor [Pedobacter sp. MC2016-14]MCD0489365.1 TonB-dependent receptor [Pedobacter sp. MC2016-14]
MNSVRLKSFNKPGSALLSKIFTFLLMFYTLQGVAQQPATFTVSGVISTNSGETLPGVSVKVKGTTVGAVTDVSGKFTLSAPSSTSILQVSYVGFQIQEISINGRNVINVKLQEDQTSLDEVLVVGYGTQKKANLTGAVATVSGSTLTQRASPNAANLIQGRITGVQVTQPSGEPGRDNPNFLIRGRSTYGGSTTPLILIDGVAGSFNNLSPDDIENVTVLKDASSAAIYGARAANGVILVTTKKGKKGETVISYRANIARHVATALPDLITNSAEYMEMYNTAATRSGIAYKYPATEIEKYRNSNGDPQYPSFDNIDYYVNPATVMNHSLSISGGSEKSTFNISGGYLDQDAVFKGYKFKRYNALLNYSSQLSKAITVGTIMNMTYKDRKEPPFTGENMALLVYAAGPLYGPFLPDGSGRVVSRAYELEGRNRNPQEAYAMGEQTTKEYNLNAQAYIDIKPFKGLTWSSKIAINYTDEYYKMYQHPYDAYLLQKPAGGNSYVTNSFGPDILGVTDQYAKTLNPTIYSTLTYEKTIAQDHNFKALAGYEQLFNKYQSLRGRRTNSVAPILEDLTGYSASGESLYFSHPRLPSLAGPSEWGMRSFFGRINYDYKGRYLVEGNLRYDGTSKVSPEYRWGVFPSFSLGWLLTEEDFMKEKFKWLSSFKVRGSYGTLGNQDIGTYLYQNNIILTGGYPFGNAGFLQGGTINDFKDQSLRWESTTSIDLGFDMSVKNGLLGLTFDWFRRSTYNILAAPPVPLSMGLNAPTINNGKMQSQGFELALTHQNKIGEVSYGLNFLISTAKNKVIELLVPSKGTTINQVGLPYGSHYLYQWDGVFQVEDIGNPSVPKHALNANPKAGDLKMKDINGDGVVNPDDRVVVDGAYPDFNYSFGFNVGYKRFSMNAFFQGVSGIKNRVNNWGIDPFMQGTAPTTKWRDAWTPENRSNTLPGIYVAGYSPTANYAGSTFFLQNASYLRLKNIILNYDVPVGILSKIGIKNLGVYVSADNLFTITDYEGGDPERSSVTGNFAQYPQTRIYNLGFNVKF